MKTATQHDCKAKPDRAKLLLLIPSLLLATLVADLGLRFIPYNRIFYHAWEAATLYATADGSFSQNFHFASDRSYGDLSYLGNRPSSRQFYKEVFTTDDFGYRNLPSAGNSERTAAILVGDSFAVGASNSDDETLSAQLTSHLPFGRVYNGASAHPQWSKTKELIERLHMRGGLLIWQVSERVPLPASVQKETTYVPGNDPLAVLPSRTINLLQNRLDLWTESFLDYSPLRTFLTRRFQIMENNQFFPNASENLVVAGQLRNGDNMLFLGSEVQNFYHPRYDSPAYLSEISGLVHGTGNEILVLLVPDKYGVYYPLLRDGQQPHPTNESHLDRLERDLRRLDIPVINLMSPLRSQAEEGLQTRTYNYRLDDTHWNRAGIQTAATEVLRAWSNPSGAIRQASLLENWSQ